MTSFDDMQKQYVATTSEACEHRKRGEHELAHAALGRARKLMRQMRILAFASQVPTTHSNADVSAGTEAVGAEVGPGGG